jgi:hypothetical protein
MLSRRRFVVALQAVALIHGSLAAAQQPSASSSSKARQKTEQHLKASAPAAAENDQGLYRNPDFGFSYHVRYGWVDRTREMQQEETDPSRSRLLLAVFERPPGVIGETVNSAVVITVESALSYPGLRTAADYMGPLTELTTGKGFKVTEEPYEISGGAQPLVRADFAKDLGRVIMYQSSIVMLHKGSVVLFTFIGGSQDEVEELVEKLAFPGAGKRR